MRYPGPVREYAETLMKTLNEDMQSGKLDPENLKESILQYSLSSYRKDSTVEISQQEMMSAFEKSLNSTKRPL